MKRREFSSTEGVAVPTLKMFLQIKKLYGLKNLAAKTWKAYKVDTVVYPQRRSYSSLGFAINNNVTLVPFEEVIPPQKFEGIMTFQCGGTTSGVSVSDDDDDDDNELGDDDNEETVLKAGELFLCIKDFIMNDGEVAYTFGKIYKCESHGYLTDNSNHKYHSMSNAYMKEHFTKP